MTLDDCLDIEREKELYVPCTNPEHGFGQDCTIDGVTAPAKFVLCPMIQMTPRPALLFHSEEQYLTSALKYFKDKGYLL